MLVISYYYSSGWQDILEINLKFILIVLGVVVAPEIIIAVIVVGISMYCLARYYKKKYSFETTTKER